MSYPEPTAPHHDAQGVPRPSLLERPHPPNVRSPSPTRILALVLAGGLLMALTTPPTAWGQIKQRTVEELISADRIKSSRQRELASELSRRHLGTPLTGGEIRDLEVLQRLLDGRAIDREDVFEQQALGVAFGDVMAKNLDLHWVVVAARRC